MSKYPNTKKCSISVIVKEIQIRFKMRFHYTCYRMGKTQMACGSKHCMDGGRTAAILRQY